MIKRFLLVATLLLAACSSIAALNQFQVNASLFLKPSNNSTSPELKTPSSVAEVAQVECNGEIPAELKAKLGKYQLAQKSDFVASIRAYEQENPRDKVTCSIFTTDFNEDNLKDYSLLLVAQDNTTFHFTILLNQGNGSFTPVETKTFKSITSPEDGIIYTSMSFKPPKTPGVALREYFPLKPGTPERKIFEAQPAIELWRAINTDLAGVPQDLEVSTLAYCSDIFYFVDGVKTIGVCD
jgi:hypothetical protein